MSLLTQHPRRRAAGIMAALATVLVAAPGCSMTPSATAPGQAQRDSVTGITWEWTETTTPADLIEVARPARYTLRFKENGEAQIRYDCNHGGGLYQMAGGELSFGPLTATRIPCGENSQSFAYQQQLQIVSSYYTEGGELFLELQQEGVTMRFRKANGG